MGRRSALEGAERDPRPAVTLRSRVGTAVRIRTDRLLLVGLYMTDRTRSPPIRVIAALYAAILPLDEAVFLIVSESNGRTDGRAETLLEPVK